MRVVPIVTVLLSLALTSAAAAAPVLGPQAYFAQPQSGALDEKAEPVNPTADYSGPPLEVQTTFVGRSALEPTIALDKAGNAFYVAGYFNDPGYGAGSHTYVMRSKDGNKSWQDNEPKLPGGSDDPPRDLDPFILADPDFGRVFNVSLVGAGSYVSYTDDGGETWQHSAVTDPGVNDHQSIVTAIAPDANTLLTPLDPAFPKLVYYCVNEVSRTGCVLSRDGGRTWQSTGGSAYLGAGTNPGDSGIGPVCSALTGHLQSDRAGRVIQPSGHCGQPYVSITEDGGTTWNQILVNDKIRAADTHTEMYADSEGNYYYVWIDPVHFLPWMATSTDAGKTWSDPVNVAPPGVHSVNFPTIVAGEKGRVAITFSGSTGADEESKTRPWNAYVAMSTNALDKEPLFVSTIANRKGDPIHRGPCRGRCGGVFDFADIQLSPVDGLFWATSSDSCTDDDGCNDAYDSEDLPATQTPGKANGMAIRQLGGPKLTGPLPQVTATRGPVPAAGPAAQRDTTKPVVRLAVSKRSFKVRRPKLGRRARTAARFTTRLSESATVLIRIDRLTTARKARKGGKRRTKATRVGALQTSAAGGVNRLSFTGKVGRRYLKRGRYRAVAIARDPAGNVGRSKAVKFRVR